VVAGEPIRIKRPTTSSRRRRVASTEDRGEADPQLASSQAPTPPQLGTDQAARAGVQWSMLDKARHIRDDQERHGTRLTGRTLAALVGISDGYARRLLRQIDSDTAVTS